MNCRPTSSEPPTMRLPRRRPAAARPQRVRAFDASEGTALDPLRDKSLGFELGEDRAVSVEPPLERRSPSWLSLSMTGFARAQDHLGPWRYAWEIKTVNSKGLDLRLRAPPNFDALEVKARAQIVEASDAWRLLRQSLRETRRLSSCDAHQSRGAR